LGFLTLTSALGTHDPAIYRAASDGKYVVVFTGASLGAVTPTVTLVLGVAGCSTIPALPFCNTDFSGNTLIDSTKLYPKSQSDLSPFTSPPSAEASISDQYAQFLYNSLLGRYVVNSSVSCKNSLKRFLCKSQIGDPCDGSGNAQDVFVSCPGSCAGIRDECLITNPCFMKECAFTTICPASNVMVSMGLLVFLTLFYYLL